MFETVDLISDKLVDTVDKSLKNSESLQMRDFAGRFTADVIGDNGKL